jgi:hypothetical protein
VQGYYYIYPNAIMVNFLAANDNGKKIKSVLDPVVDKMSKMPGINAASLIKNPVAGPQKAPAPDTNHEGMQMGQASNTPAMPANMAGHAGMNMRLGRRHGPGEKTAMTMGIVDMDSRLLGEAELKSSKFADALMNSIPKGLNGQLRGHLVGGGAVFKVAANETAVVPAWRKAYVHLIASTGAVVVDASSLRALSPDMGAYVNEVSETTRTA